MLLWAPSAWLQGRWQDAVLLRADAQGRWVEVTPGIAAPPQATQLPGPVLPGLVDAHSHAFQRAFAGLAERRTSEHDDFWSWRDRMYGVALRITPAQLRAVAAQLYTELLLGGFTQVCEFHYLHHDPQGTPYADPLAMSQALAQAAADAGLGLTMLPVLYERAGFTQPQLRPDQRRFATDAAAVLRLRDGVRALQAPHVSAGVALHSLRAAAPESLHTLRRALEGDDAPIHIHVAEQTAEVDDCLAHSGARPIEWLAREGLLDARWQLVHATHTTPAEVEAVARSGAGVVLCPSTEANLGDGFADVPGWLASTTPLSLGTDSHVGRAWPEELRWLDYGQRLQRRHRNVAAAPALHEGATAARLFERMLAGGAAAAGFKHWGLEPGARADLLVLDEQAPGLPGVPASHRLDALVFVGGGASFSEVWVAGRRVVAQGRHVDAARLGAGYAQAMAALWPT
jgi:formimidoylglutamate deiminase